MITNNISNFNDLLLVVKISGGSISLLLSITSLFANVLLILAFRKFNSGDCFAFYLISWQLIAADIANQILFQLLLAIPIMLSGIAIYGHGIILRIFGIFNTVTYSAVLFFSALMTLNRATVFFSPKVNELIFSRFRIFIPISVIWVYAILIGIILDLGGCYKMYSEKDLLLGFVCTEETVHPIIWAVRQYFRYSPNVLPVLMFCTYIAIFIYLKITNPIKITPETFNDQQARKKFQTEKLFLLQGFLIFAMIEIEDIAFNFLLGPPNNIVQLWLNIICNWIMIAENLFNPIILFTFNNRIRIATKHVLLCRPTVVENTFLNPKAQQIIRINQQQINRIKNRAKINLANSSKF